MSYVEISVDRPGDENEVVTLKWFLIISNLEF